MEGPDDLVIAGYVACATCGTWIPEETPEGRKFRCRECFVAARDANLSARVRYEAHSREFVTPPKSRPKKRPRAPRTPEILRVERVWNRARTRATARLVQIYKPTYELLLAEEKAKLGIDPALRPMPGKPVAVTQAILDDLEEASEREARRAEARLINGA